MRCRLQESLIRIASATIFTAVATSIGSPIGVAVAQEAASADRAFTRPDETRLIGREVADVGLRFADGRDGRLSDLWADRPVLVTLVFSRCAGICSPYLGLLKNTVDQVGASGDRYQMVVISFDARDRPEDMVALAKHHGLEADPGWTFAVPAGSADLEALCRSLDFDFQWDDQRRQFNHPAMTVALRAGKFVRLSVGEQISPRRFKEMVADAWGEFVPMYPDPSQRGGLFRCFDYDPERGFSLNWGMLVLVFPAVAALTLAGLMFMAARGIGSPSAEEPAAVRTSQE